MPIVASAFSKSPTDSGPSLLRVTAFPMAGFIVLLLLPHFMTIRPWSLTFKLGYVISGDEPHYLLLIGSLVEDGDVDVSNNYDAVHAGQTWNGGRFLRNHHQLDHHTYLATGQERIGWSEIYQPMRDGSMDWITDPFGRYYRPTQAGKSPVPPGIPEYSIHQPGIAFWLAPLTFWARGTRFIEPIALLGSALAAIAALFFFRKILGCFGIDRTPADAISLVTFPGTSIWFYSRSLFLESHLLMCMCGTYYCVLSRQRPLLGGLFAALAIQLKAYYLLAVIPIGIDVILRRDWKYLVRYLLPVAISLGLFLLQNRWFYGDYFKGSQPYLVGSFREGALGHWFSRSHGLLFVSPVAMIAALCWPRFLRRYPREAALLGGAFLINFIVMSIYAVWWGATCYGTRYLTPFLPFLFASLAASPEWLSIRRRKGILFWTLTGFSIFGNAAAVFYYQHFWENPPIGAQVLDFCCR